MLRQGPDVRLLVGHPPRHNAERRQGEEEPDLPVDLPAVVQQGVDERVLVLGQLPPVDDLLHDRVLVPERLEVLVVGREPLPGRGLLVRVEVELVEQQIRDLIGARGVEVSPGTGDGGVDVPP